MLTVGRVDFVKINHHVANHIVAESELSAGAIRPLPFVVEEVSLHFMVPKNRPGAGELIDEFNRHFRAMKQDGRIETLREAYMEALRPGSNGPRSGPHRIGPSAAEAIGR
jgi:ABC-type amino acid transport substrate-binding protein